MARYDFRLPDSEIGRLNLKEFDALLKRKKAADNMARLNAGVVAAAIYNTAPYGDPKRKVVSPLDFVPDWKPKERDLTELSPEEQKAFWMNTFFKKS
jgi:hypothetical protein